MARSRQIMRRIRVHDRVGIFASMQRDTGDPARRRSRRSRTSVRAASPIKS
jgi:hypothetical protein